IGAHVGPLLYREGDYVGANVNLAARVTSAARRNQFVVTEAVRQAVDDEDCEFAPLGSRSLKGVGEPVELFEVHTAEERARRVPDPVCGMERGEATPAPSSAQVSWHRLLCGLEAPGEGWDP